MYRFLSEYLRRTEHGRSTRVGGAFGVFLAVTTKRDKVDKGCMDTEVSEDFGYPQVDLFPFSVCLVTQFCLFSRSVPHYLVSMVLLCPSLVYH